jgi:hypothetical protein
MEAHPLTHALVMHIAMPAETGPCETDPLRGRTLSLIGIFLASLDHCTDNVLLDCSLVPAYGSSENFTICWCREVPIISLESITGSVVMLPQIVPALRNNSPRRPLTLQYRDPYSWDLPTLSGMLSAFFRASGTTSLPPLEEYTMLPDKVNINILILIIVMIIHAQPSHSRLRCIAAAFL